MPRLLSTTLFTIALMAAGGNAAVYKGQREYQKKCKSCHANGQEIAAAYKRQEWKILMEDHGKGLAELHLKSTKAKDSWHYFEGSSYKKHSKDLKDFMIEFAKDSGNVPACN